MLEFANDGHIVRESMLWAEGMADWVKAATVEGLFPPGALPPPLPRRISIGPPRPWTRGGTEGRAISGPMRAGILREGGLLVVLRGCEPMLPMNCCIKCGAHARKLVRKRFYWHEPAVYLCLLAGPLIYLIVACIVQQRMELSCPLCAVHHKQRKLLLVAIWGCFAGFVAVIAVGVVLALDLAVCALLSMVLLVTSLVLAAVLAQVMVKPKRITAERGVFSGASEAYLAELSK